jgi:hypothetical protein
MTALGAGAGHVFEWVTVRRAVGAIAVGDAIAVEVEAERIGLVALKRTLAAVRAAGAVVVARE